MVYNTILCWPGPEQMYQCKEGISTCTFTRVYPCSGACGVQGDCEETIQSVYNQPSHFCECIAIVVLFAQTCVPVHM